MVLDILIKYSKTKMPDLDVSCKIAIIHKNQLGIHEGRFCDGEAMWKSLQEHQHVSFICDEFAII